MPDAAGEPLLELRAVMARLRAECAWKAAQTHESLLRHLLEEAHEVVDAVETGSADDVREELGDLLLQIYFHAAVAAEREEGQGRFDVDDVAAGLVAKLRRRNPHVFAPEAGPAPRDAAAVNDVWEQVKAAEKPRARLDDGIPPALPALLAADKVLERMARQGREPRVAELPAPATDDEEAVGERLLAVVAQARAAGVDPERALRLALRRRLR